MDANKRMGWSMYFRNKLITILFILLIFIAADSATAFRPDSSGSVMITLSVIKLLSPLSLLSFS